MKKIIFFLSTLSILILSCQSDESKINEFKDIYFDILMVREKYQDTAIANPKVREVLKKYGFTELSFRDYSMELFSNNPQAFTQVIDSVKTKAERKLVDFGKERMKLDSANKKNAGK